MLKDKILEYLTEHIAWVYDWSKEHTDEIVQDIADICEKDCLEKDKAFADKLYKENAELKKLLDKDRIVEICCRHINPESYFLQIQDIANEIIKEGKK